VSALSLGAGGNCVRDIDSDRRNLSMKKKKRTLYILLILAVAFTVFSMGCSNKAAPTATTTSETGEPSYVITYDGATGFLGNSGQVSVAVIFEIINSGDELLHLLPGKYDLKDESEAFIIQGQPIVAYPPIIAPGEKSYYYDNFFIKDLEEISDFAAFLYPVVERTEIPIVRLDVSDDASIYVGVLDTIQMRGTIKNNTNQNLENICVAAILFNGQNPIAVIYANLEESLTIGSSVEFNGEDLDNGKIFQGLQSGSISYLDVPNYKPIVIAFPYQ